MDEESFCVFPDEALWVIFYFSKYKIYLHKIVYEISQIYFNTIISNNPHIIYSIYNTNFVTFIFNISIIII